MIDNIKLKNFKCYEDQPFEFRNLTVFCGANSVGKSTAIQALLLLVQSNFDYKLPFNGNLISLGEYGDIHCHSSLKPEVSIEISSDESVNVSWGCTLSSGDDTGRDPEFLSLSYGDPAPLLHIVDSFQYIQAERLGPEDYYPNSTSALHERWLGKQGEFTSQILSQLSDGLRFENKNDLRIHSKSRGTHISNSIKSWMDEIAPDVSIASKNEKSANISYNTFTTNSLPMRSKNVGFGVSYALSVVAALLIAPKGGLVIIENPEAHLHPRGQSYIGRLIALTAMAGVQVVVETHSDHLINGMRLMVRKGDVRSDHIVFYNINSSVANKVAKIHVNEQGQLSEWPEGFFDQQVKDMQLLMSGDFSEA
jgi:predicted ATPase